MWDTWVQGGGAQDSNYFLVSTHMKVFRYLNHQNGCTGAYQVTTRPELIAGECHSWIRALKNGSDHSKCLLTRWMMGNRI